MAKVQIRYFTIRFFIYTIISKFNIKSKSYIMLKILSDVLQFISLQKVKDFFLQI